MTVFKWTRSVLGLGESVNWPFSTRIVANMLPRADRGLGMGIFNSGAAASALVAPVLIAPLAAAYGWRWAFLAVGAAGLAWVVLWLGLTGGRRATAFDNDPALVPGKRGQAPFVPSTRRAVPAKGACPLFPLAAIARPFKIILTHPGFWLLVLVSITINPCWYFCCDWIPGYLMKAGGFSLLREGLLSTVIYLGGDVGNFVGGGLVKYLTHRGWPVSKARGATVLFGACLATSMAAVPHLPDAYLAVGVLAAAAIGINLIVPNQTACQADVSFANTAQLAGLTGLSANIVAALVNPRIGRYVDATGHYDLIFDLVAVFPWIAAAAILVFDARMGRSRDGA